MDLEIDDSELNRVPELTQCKMYMGDGRIPLHPFGAQQGSPGADGYDYSLTIVNASGATQKHDLVVDVEEDGSLMLAGSVALPGRRNNFAFGKSLDGADDLQADAITRMVGTTFTIPDATTTNANAYHTFGGIPEYRLILTVSDSKQVNNYELTLKDRFSYRMGDLVDEDNDVGGRLSLIHEIGSAAMHHGPIGFSVEGSLLRNDYPGAIPAHDPAISDADLLANARSVETLLVSADNRDPATDGTAGRDHGTITADGNVTADVDVFWLGTQTGSTAAIGLSLSPDWTIEFELQRIGDGTATSGESGTPGTAGAFEGSLTIYSHDGMELEPALVAINEKNHKKLTVRGFECGKRYYAKVTTAKPGDYHLAWKVTKNS